jgi:VWFA-related protein
MVLPVSRFLRFSTALATACAAFGALAAAQVFRGGTELVILTVTVSDSHSRQIAGLEAKDFQIFENGIPQTISLFLREPQPISLSLLIDSSTSMADKLPVAKEAALGFVARMRPQDAAQVVTFDNQMDIRQPFTNKVTDLQNAIREIQTADGGTSLYTSIYVSLSEVGAAAKASAESKNTVRRQAIVVLSDGVDTASRLSYEDVLEQANRSMVAIYAIGVRENGTVHIDTRNYDFMLRSLAQATGGRAFFVNDISQLRDIYSQIAEELENQYVIGYVSNNLKRDGAWRTVSIRANRIDSVARTKSGYFATPPRR